jgi:transposase
MMGEADPRRALFYNISLETFVPGDHPLHRIRPLIDDRAIRRAGRDLYAPIGRPSIPPRAALAGLVGGYLLSIPNERRLVMELQCNMALRWFVGLNLDQDAWDASTFSQTRRRRFDESGLLEGYSMSRSNARWPRGWSAVTSARPALWFAPTPVIRAVCRWKSPWTRRSTSGGCAPRTVRPRTRRRRRRG